MHSPRDDDVLDKVGNIIGYMQIIIFTILLICFWHFTFNAPACPFAATFYDCLGMLSLTLTMFALSFILAMGISLRQAVYVLPWLITTVVVVVTGLVYLSINPHFLLATFGSVILFLLILSWYPIYKLYLRYCSERKARDQQLQSPGVEENYPSRTASYSDEAVPDCQEAKRGDSASYEAAVMCVELNSPFVAGNPAFDWRTDLYSKIIKNQ